jgi:hypothetical protein
MQQINVLFSFNRFDYLVGIEEKRKAMLDDVGELFDEWMPRLVKIQVDGHFEGDSKTTTGRIMNRNQFQVI